MIFALDQLRSLPVAWPLMRVTCEYLHQRSSLKAIIFLNCFNGFVKSYTWTANENGTGVTKIMTTSKTQTSGSARSPSVSWELLRMLMRWSYFILNQTAGKKSGLTGINLSIFSFITNETLSSQTLSSLKRRRHLNRWGFKWKFTECSIILMDFIKLLDFFQSGTFKTM